MLVVVVAAVEAEATAGARAASFGEGRFFECAVRGEGGDDDELIAKTSRRGSLDVDPASSNDVSVPDTKAAEGGVLFTLSSECSVPSSILFGGE